MKYIRTKDGRVIPFLDEDKETKLPNRDLRFYYIQPNHVIAFIGKNEIINQANTVEELCDEYVLVSPYRFKRPKTATELEKDFDEMRTFYTKSGDELYGAIWVCDENGVPILKSVAHLEDPFWKIWKIL